MKVKLLILLGLISFQFNSFSQLPKDDNGDVVFSEVVKTEGLSQKQLSDNARLWVVSKLKSSDNMVNVSDTSSDKIVGTGNIKLADVPYYAKHKTKDMRINFKVIVFCKEGRYKYKISNISLSYLYLWYNSHFPITSDLITIEVPKNLENKKKKTEEFRSNVKRQVSSEIKALIKSLKASMNEKKEAQEDW